MQFDIADDFVISFLAAMQKHRVRYMLIGGVAVNFHGVNRSTQDTDIWLAPTNQNRDAFVDSLIELGYTEDEIADLRNEDFTGIFKCTIGEMPNTIDCLTVVHHNINFDDAEETAISHDIGNGVMLNVVDFDFLRKMKVLTHRPQDWADVVRLDELKNKDK